MNIIKQQLELHFGDNYSSVYKQAKKYCSSLLSRPWWGANRETLIGNEGGPQGMRLNAMLFIIEHEDDIETGLRAYGSSLRLEYGSDKRLDILLDPEIEVPPTGEGEPRADSLESHSLDGLSDIIRPLSAIEEDFFTTNDEDDPLELPEASELNSENMQNREEDAPKIGIPVNEKATIQRDSISPQALPKTLELKKKQTVKDSIQTPKKQ